jgi:hypothetical protein
MNESVEAGVGDKINGTACTSGSPPVESPRHPSFRVSRRSGSLLSRHACRSSLIYGVLRKQLILQINQNYVCSTVNHRRRRVGTLTLYVTFVLDSTNSELFAVYTAMIPW